MTQFHVEVDIDYDTEGLPEGHPDEDQGFHVVYVRVTVTNITLLAEQSESLSGISVRGGLEDPYLTEVTDNLITEAFQNVKR
jgi:hypothetical protein